MNNLEDKDIQPEESDDDTALFGICSNFLRFMLRSEFIFYKIKHKKATGSACHQAPCHLMHW